MLLDNKLNSRSKLMIGAAVVSFMFLAILAIMNYTPVNDKVFGTDNFYIGNYGSKVDPKEQYDLMYKNVIASAVGCFTTMTPASSPMIAGNNVWLVDGATIESLEDLKGMSVDGDLSVIKPYKLDGQKIISPVELTFINSNVVQHNKDSISITAYAGTSHIIEFNNIKSWWCHAGKQDPTKHTEVVGAGGINPKCVAGYVIGEATEETTVNFYEVDGDGNKTPCSFEVLFTIE